MNYCMLNLDVTDENVMFDVARNITVTNISDMLEILGELFSLLSFLFFNVLSERLCTYVYLKVRLR